MSGITEVIVVGGGYGGVMAANRLTSNTDVAVTLINPRSCFIERIRLHQLAGGSDDAVIEYRDVLNPRVRLLVGSVARIDAPVQTVVLSDGSALGYDYLVYAVGSSSGRATEPGVNEFAYPIATFEQAVRLRQRLLELPTSAPVTVVGGGASGIETATELAEQGRHVTLVCAEQLGSTLHPRVRRLLAARLPRLGVAVLDGKGARVTRVGEDTLWLENGRELRSALTVWTAGFSVPDLARRSGLSTDAQGRLLTDETLTSIDDHRIVAAGDSAAPSGWPFRMSCQAAVQLGPHAADTLLHRIANERPSPVALAFIGQCISLGRNRGIIQLAGRDDVVRRAAIGGRTGAWLKELVCQSTVNLLTQEAQRPGRLRLPAWATDRRRSRVLADMA